MMVHRIEHYEEGVRQHADRAQGSDYTLCGMALEGDDDWSPAESVQGKITCKACAEIIRYCKTIPAKEIKLEG